VTTALITRPEMKLHDQGPGHVEQPARLSAVLRALEEAKLPLKAIECQPARIEDLLRIHTQDHVDIIKRTCEKSLRYPDPDIATSKGSWEAALLAAGSGIAACDAVLSGKANNAFCAVRPPGHHAEKDHAMGFCLFNNIAIAARWLRDVKGVKRVAILDWDVHHGNGTQHSFYDDDTVYYASLHQHPLYPGTGFPEERGAGNTNLNVQMRPFFGPAEWLEALDKKVLPEFERFSPDFLLISAGFDAHKEDPLGSQKLESDTYSQMTARVKHISNGKIVAMMEGGYDLDALAEASVAHVRELTKAEKS
jgi:acetoin utilization deacetylase AcuC-like enzyme